MGFFENLPSKGPVRKSGCSPQAVILLVVLAFSVWALLEAVKVPL